MDRTYYHSTSVTPFLTGSLPAPQAKAPAVHSIANKPNAPSTKPSGAKPVGEKVIGVVQKAQQNQAVPKPAQNKVANGGQSKRPLSDDSDSVRQACIAVDHIYLNLV